MITLNELHAGLIVIHDKTQGEYRVENHNTMVKIGNNDFGPSVWQPAVTYYKNDNSYGQLFVRDTTTFMKNFSIKKED